MCVCAQHTFVEELNRRTEQVCSSLGMEGQMQQDPPDGLSSLNLKQDGGDLGTAKQWLSQASSEAAGGVIQWDSGRPHMQVCHITGYQLVTD